MFRTGAFIWGAKSSLGESGRAVLEDKFSESRGKMNGPRRILAVSLGQDQGSRVRDGWGTRVGRGMRVTTLRK